MAKGKQAFRTIREVADWLVVPAHVLRFWESKFPQIKPVKRAGGRRYYRPKDMELVGGLKVLLHEQGMTIRGAQKLLREKGVDEVAALAPSMADLTLDGDVTADWGADDTVDRTDPDFEVVLPLDEADDQPGLPFGIVAPKTTAPQDTIVTGDATETGSDADADAEDAEPAPHPPEATPATEASAADAAAVEEPTDGPSDGITPDTPSEMPATDKDATQAAPAAQDTAADTPHAALAEDGRHALLRLAALAQALRHQPPQADPRARDALGALSALKDRMSLPPRP